MFDFENISIGCDIEDISRFERHVEDSRFIERLFTKSERDYCLSCKSPAKHIAARFCAKEAIYKALSGFGESGMNYRDFEIYHNDNGVPQVRFLVERYKNYKFKISLSHNNDKAIAYVLAYKN